LVDHALESGEDEVSVNKVSDEAFHGGVPLDEIRLVVGNRDIAESHGDEPHLFSDAGGFSGIQLPIPLPLLERGLWFGFRSWNCSVKVSETAVALI